MLTKMPQVWLVTAEEFNPETPGPYFPFMMAFSTREQAHEVYARGERELNWMHWNLQGVPFDDLKYAHDDLDILIDDYARCSG